ncbi:hypothetical protein VTL71DRAFT_5164 [Oculimacula yallundae]|uniref:Uncharacterized protein n=1 Tax=Oculimacula yallundae TaxID=86028 RepID=A0ABR4C0C3_9HELO
MKDLSEITVLAEKVLSAIERDSNLGTIMGSIRQRMLHQTPEFVVVLKELSEKTGEVGSTTRLTEHFKHLEGFRLRAALLNTIRVLRAMTKGLLGVIKGKKELAKHVRVKMLERLGKFHYGIEQLCRGIGLFLNFRLLEYEDLLVRIREVRAVLKAQNGEEEPANA